MVARFKALKSLPGYASLILFFVLAFLARTLWLGHIPGLNGDEAGYGLQVLENQVIFGQTNSGNPSNPFYLIPLWILQRLFPLSFWVLRLPSLIAGLLLIVLGFLLLRRLIGILPAMVFAILAAGLPDLIVYSRFGWDPSETGLAMLVVFYFALSKRWWLLIIAEIAAIWVHPTNIFIIPALIIFSLVELYKQSAWLRRNIVFYGASILAGGVLGLGLVKIIGRPRIANLLTHVGLSRIAQAIVGIHVHNVAIRLFSPQAWLSLFSLYGDLLSGVAVYRYIVGPVSVTTLALHNIVVWCTLLSLIILGCWRSIKQNDFQVVTLLVGLLASLVLMFAFIGVAPLIPNHERYGQYLIVPTILLVSLCASKIFLSNKHKWQTIAIALAIASLGLLSVSMNYFIPFFETGGLTHRTFYTGPIEPKAMAVSIILSDHSVDNGTTVLAEDYWLTTPMQYLLYDHSKIKVEQYMPGTTDSAAVSKILMEGGYVVGFYNGPLKTTIMPEIHSPALSQRVILGYSNKPILIIWHISEISSSDYISCPSEELISWP